MTDIGETESGGGSERMTSQKGRDSQDTTGSSFKPENENFDWPYEISIDLRKSPKPKVAFLSGEERQYFPENPGHSRIGVEYSMNLAATDVPNPKYYPPPLGVYKPISLLGYGIGGLLAPRFAKDYKVSIPDPGAYQTVVDRKVKVPTRPYDLYDNVLRWQCRVGFGSTNTVSRFGIERTDLPPGPGTYDTSNVSNCPCIKRIESFGYKRYLSPAILTVCIVDGGEKCCECGEVQLADYYRSKGKLRHPNFRRLDRFAMCRKCYCKAWNGHFPYWIKSDLQRMFRKARHCNYIHDHQKLHQFMRKASCKDVNKLTRKEVVLNKYYPDCCPPQYTYGSNK